MRHWRSSIGHYSRRKSTGECSTGINEALLLCHQIFYVLICVFCKIGRYLGQELEALRDAYACIGDVRGCGLFQGVEFVVCDKRRSSDATVAEPDDDTTQKVVDYLQTVNIISSRGEC